LYIQLKCNQIRFRLGLCPRPHWGELSLQRSPDPQLDLRGLLLREGEKKGWEGRGGKRRGAEGREGGRRVPKVTTSKKILDPPLAPAHHFSPSYL